MLTTFGLIQQGLLVTTYHPLNMLKKSPLLALEDDPRFHNDDDTVTYMCALSPEPDGRRF